MIISPIKNFYRYKKYQYLTNKKKIFINKKSSKSINIPNLDLIMKDLNANGFYVIENFFSKKQCTQLIDQINEFIKKHPKLLWQDENKSDNRIFGAENISNKFYQDIKNFITFSKNIGEAYLKYKIDLFMLMANKINFKKNNLGSGSGWHKDAYSKQFKSIIYLNDVDSKNGPFEIIKNSNNDWFTFNMFRKLIDKFPSTRFTENEILAIINKKKIEEIKFPAGTLILADTSNLHRGKPLNDGTRYAITSYFFSKGSLEEHKNHFKPKLDNIID